MTAIESSLAFVFYPRDVDLEAHCDFNGISYFLPFVLTVMHEV